MYMTEGIWTYVHNVSKSDAEIEDHKIKDIPFHTVSLRSTWKRLKKKKKNMDAGQWSCTCLASAMMHVQSPLL